MDVFPAPRNPVKTVIGIFFMEGLQGKASGMVDLGPAVAVGQCPRVQTVLFWIKLSVGTTNRRPSPNIARLEAPARSIIGYNYIRYMLHNQGTLVYIQTPSVRVAQVRFTMATLGPLLSGGFMRPKLPNELPCLAVFPKILARNVPTGSLLLPAPRLDGPPRGSVRGITVVSTTSFRRFAS